MILRAFVSAVLASVSMSASAIDYEIGTGATHYKANHDGLWHQEQFPHTFDLNAVPFSLGVSGERNGIRYRAEYLHLGWFYNTAQTTADWKYYPGTTYTPTHSLFGRGQVGGLAFTASRDASVVGIPVYAEAGLYLYSAHYQVNTRRLADSVATKSYVMASGIAPGAILGVGIRHKGLDIGVRYIGLEAGHGEMPILVNHAYSFMVKVYF